MRIDYAALWNAGGVSRLRGYFARGPRVFLPQIKKKPEFGLILIRQTPALVVYDSTIAEKSELVKHLREKSRKFARKGEFPQTKAAALVCAKRARMVQYPVRSGSKAAPIWVRETVKTQVRGRKPFCGTIVPGGVYGGDGAIFAAENPIFQSKNRFLTVSAPGNP